MYNIFLIWVPTHTSHTIPENVLMINNTSNNLGTPLELKEKYKKLRMKKVI